MIAGTGHHALKLAIFLPFRGKRRLRLTGRIAALKGDIVDEPRVAEFCGCEKPDRSLAARGDGAKGFGMTGFEIIRDETRCGNGGPGSIERGLNAQLPH